MQNILITGANRGLGLEFVRQYAEQGDKVFACCRQPRDAAELHQLAADYPIDILQLDIANPDSRQLLVEQLQGQPLDILINNAGIYGPRNLTPEQLEQAPWQQVFITNSVAPVLLTQSLRTNLKHGAGHKAIFVTSKMGSMGDNHSGGSYLYRASKAALNASVRSLAIDLANEPLYCLLVHPGWVQTDMGGASALITPKQSVAGMREQITALSKDESGQFVAYDGAVIPW